MRRKHQRKRKRIDKRKKRKRIDEEETQGKG